MTDRKCRVPLDGEVLGEYMVVAYCDEPYGHVEPEYAQSVQTAHTDWPTSGWSVVPAVWERRVLCEIVFRAPNREDLPDPNPMGRGVIQGLAEGIPDDWYGYAMEPFRLAYFTSHDGQFRYTFNDSKVPGDPDWEEEADHGE